ncbi:GNAT family N-acetyltransferase [Pedobacter hiemivivus]|uniref:GNAT family N-acetyltransferase n=1 Tax=Pedobacter hiemivivus TaxID=2530454 RepID=A0A4U1GLL2_9SPHI|nr:GNAT family N-acetyltransferase [Pedobacter hiemivivus]TKC63903.1 GNAT family N-acetyltransferase [Pedobacter hiemivivus]
MIAFVRTDSTNQDFIDLVKLLDKDLAVRDGEEHSFYAQFNKIDLIENVVVAYENEKAVGCGAFKYFDDLTAEIKRMYVLETARGKKVASKVLIELEAWAKEMAFNKTILETGIRQPEAIGLYGKMGYAIIPNYGQYEGVENSVCFEKAL